MKVHLKIQTIVLGLFALVLASCTDDDTSGIQQPESPHLKYFGFTIVDTYWDDPTDSQEKTTYIDEVHSFSNFADILVVTPQDDLMARMNAMKNLQMKSILHLNELFFEIVGTNSQSGTEYSLRTDYKNRWDQFVQLNRLQENEDLVQCFYIGEEPTWNGISASDLKSATDYAKLTVPNVPIMVVEAYPVVDKLVVAGSVDWIGFDHYFIKDPTTNADFQNELNIIKSKFIHEDQKLVLILDSHFINFAHQEFGGIALNEMKDVATNYHELAKREPKTIALIGYFWPSGFDFEQAIGARNMPEIVKNEYTRIGKEITGK